MALRLRTKLVSSADVPYGSFDNEETASGGVTNTMRSRRLFGALLILSFVLFLATIIVLAIELATTRDELRALRAENHLPPMRKSDSRMGQFTKFAVASDDGICSAAGRSILIAGGNAVDAAIAAELCIGIMSAHSSGLGGGLFITVYNKSTHSCMTIDGREVAPSAAHKTMFSNMPTDASTTGWRSIAVPGDLHGLYRAHKLFGRLPWAQVVQLAVDVADKHPVSIPMADAILLRQADILNDTTISELFLHNDTELLYVAGEFLHRPALRDTLSRLANAKDPIDEFYGNGTTARNIVEEFKKYGSIITAEDLRKYESTVTPGLLMTLPKLGLTACSPPPPSGGAVTMAILNILSGYDLQPDDFKLTAKASLTYHRIIEAMKFAYAARSRIADPTFVGASSEIAKNITSFAWAEEVRKLITEESHELSYYGAEYAPLRDSGTAHISTIDGEGNACAITSTVNLYFGSKRRSESTGIIWNDGMDDFSLPDRPNYFGYAPSKANFIEPGKRPLSSMSPLVFFDDKTGEVRLTVGAAGGSEIISSTAYTAARILWAGENVKEALDAARLHNQLIPNTTHYAPDFPEVIVRELQRRGQLMSLTEEDHSVVCAVETINGDSEERIVRAQSDFRKPGGFTQGW